MNINEKELETHAAKLYYNSRKEQTESHEHMFYAGHMLGYQHQVWSRTEMMLMLPSLLFQAAPMQNQKNTLPTAMFCFF